jgi:S-DNA-T family DNA segregation ATPase FtsK/SpoIIIE
MAKTKKSTTTTNKKSVENPEANKGWKLSKQFKLLLGCLFVLFSIALLVSFISFFVYGQADQSALNAITDRSATVKNWLGKFGAYLADLFIYRGFGAASFIFVKLFFLTGAFLILDISLKKLKNLWFWDLFVIIILSVLFGFFATTLPELGGTIGYELNLFLQDFIGKPGTLLVLIFGIIIYLIFKIKINPDAVKSFFEKKKKEVVEDFSEMKNPFSKDYNLEEFAVAEKEEEIEEPFLKPKPQFEVNKEALKPIFFPQNRLMKQLKDLLLSI